jgi:hypothetical protein
VREGVTNRWAEAAGGYAASAALRLAEQREPAHGAGGPASAPKPPHTSAQSRDGGSPMTSRALRGGRSPEDRTSAAVASTRRTSWKRRLPGCSKTLGAYC